MEMRQRYLLLLLIFAILLIVIGIVLLSVFPGLVRRGVLEAVLLKNESDAVKAWEMPPYEMKLQIWLFNISNPDEILQRAGKPTLYEVGPYGFNAFQQKVDVNFNDNGTISYRNFKWYQFDPLSSCSRCRLSDEVLVPSVPFWSLLHRLHQIGGLPKLKRFISFGLLGLGEGPFVMKTVDELLFTGYNDMLFSLAKTLHWLSPDMEFPNRMGFMYGKNASFEGPFVIKSGVDKYEEKGTIELYKGKPSVNCWSNEASNMINGSDGTVYPPFLERSDKLPLFAPDLYRSLYLEYLQDMKIDGFLAYRYSIPNWVFSSSVKENAGFCWPTDVYYPDIQTADPKTGLACLPSGLLNISKCQMGAPIVLSSPHFLYSDDEVRNSVIGLRPDFETHATLIDFEPVTGVGLSFERKLQINVAMVRDDDFMNVKRMRSVITPVLWLKESARLKEQSKSDLRRRLFTPQLVVSVTSYTLIALSLIVLAVCCLLYLHYRRIRKAEAA